MQIRIENSLRILSNIRYGEKIPEYFTGKIEYDDGGEYWFVNGILHREDGPAVIRFDGQQRWFYNNLLHRSDGPAIVHSEGYKTWFLRGEPVSAQEVFEQLTPEQKEKAIWELDQWK